MSRWLAVCPAGLAFYAHGLNLEAVARIVLEDVPTLIDKTKNELLQAGVKIE